MIALFLSDPCSALTASPCCVFDHWDDHADGSCNAVTETGSLIVQVEKRGEFHRDGSDSGGWQRMVRTGQGVVTQNNAARFAYYWLNWQ